MKNFGFFRTKVELQTPKGGRVKNTKSAGDNAAYYNEQGCNACPMKTGCGKRPVLPSGSNHPLVYVLGDAPTVEETKSGDPFTSAAGLHMRRNVPDKDACRYNTLVRTKAESGHTPSVAAVECCRQKVIEDIEKTKPAAILALGDTVLEWFIGSASIINWRGRRFPAKFGRHRCWVYPIVHPLSVMRADRAKGMDREARQQLVMFKHDINRAFREAEQGVSLGSLPYVVEELEEGIELATPKLGVAWVVKQLEAASRCDYAGVDIETNMKRPYQRGARILSIGVSTRDATFSFPIAHSESWWSSGDEIVLMSSVRAFLHSRVRKVFHNASFDMEWFIYFYGKGIVKGDLWNTWDCTQNQAYILDERKKNKVQTLDHLCLERLGMRLKMYSDVDRTRGDVAHVEKLLRYNAMDAKSHRLLFEEQDRDLHDNGLQATYEDHVRRVPSLVLMQFKGVPISQVAVQELYDSVNQKVKEITREAQETPEAYEYKHKWGVPFLIKGSGSDLCLTRIFGHIPELYKSKKDGGGFTTARGVFSSIDSPLAKKITQYREYTKLRDTYIEPCLRGPGSLVYDDDNLHCSFNSTFTETGRLSSNGPNMQNWPHREHPEVRRMVQAPPNHVIISADMKQLEVCVCALMSRDKRLLKAIRNRADIHMKYTEMLSEHVPLYLELCGGGNIKKARSAIKSLITFPFLYGAIHTTASRNVLAAMSVLDRIRAEEVSEDVARACELIEKEFWLEYRDVKAWQNALLASYIRTGYVECMNGRKRRGPLSINQIANTPIQGSASDLVVDALIRLDQRSLEEDRPSLIMNLNIHDDLTTFAHEDAVDDVIADMVEIMLHPSYENWDIKACPLGIEVAVGKDWATQKAIGTFYSDEY